MSKIKFPVITVPLELSRYAPAMQGSVLVWVNIPEDKLREHGQLIRDVVELREKLKTSSFHGEELKAIGEQVQSLVDKRFAWLSEIWSQGPVETHISHDDITAIIESCSSTDPRFFEWLIDQSLFLIQEHRNGKKYATPKGV